MKTKFLILSICLLSITLCSGQAFDNYQKTWATYYGGSNTTLQFVEADSQGNLIAAGKLHSIDDAADDFDYYNQFITTENTEFQYQNDPLQNTVIAKFHRMENCSGQDISLLIFFNLKLMKKTICI